MGTGTILVRNKTAAEIVKTIVSIFQCLSRMSLQLRSVSIAKIRSDLCPVWTAACGTWPNFGPKDAHGTNARVLAVFTTCKKW
eukprot:14151829-Ditylum_brightwellii.AAC.1